MVAMMEKMHEQMASMQHEIVKLNRVIADNSATSERMNEAMAFMDNPMRPIAMQAQAEAQGDVHDVNSSSPHGRKVGGCAGGQFPLAGWPTRLYSPC